MRENSLAAIRRAEEHLHKLCVEIAERRVGSAGNRAATDYVAAQLVASGWAVECPSFACMDWHSDGATLRVDGLPFAALVSPYSLGGRAHAPLVVVSTVAELVSCTATGAVLLLRGEIAREQLMPKHFAFYNPDEHRQIIALLEAKRPAAIIAATARNPEAAGALSPFPLIEDGDFDIPSVYMTEEEGERLAARAGSLAKLEMRATRIPAQGCNVVARRGPAGARRIVLTAHIDAKMGTPGALDNAAGVVTLLLLAERLRGATPSHAIEIVAINGEDYYAASGEMAFLAANEGRMAEIQLGVNLDALGYREGRSAFSLYECSEAMAAAVRTALGTQDGLVEGEAWYQSDHMVFMLNQVPAVAITSERLSDVLSTIAHTPADRPEIVDCGELASVAEALEVLLGALP